MEKLEKPDTQSLSHRMKLLECNQECSNQITKIIQELEQNDENLQKIKKHSKMMSKI